MASKESQLYCATKVSVFNCDNHNHMFSIILKNLGLLVSLMLR